MSTLTFAAPCGRAGRHDQPLRAPTGTWSASTSARCPASAVVVRVGDGAELGTAVSQYRHGVMERALPATGVRAAARLGPAGPGRLREVLRPRCPAAVAAAASTRAGRSASAPTSPPAPRCRPRRRHPAVRAARARPAALTPTSSCGSTTPPRRRPTGSTPSPHERGEPWLARTAGSISSEWEFAKGLQLLEEDPDLYARMERWIEAADWIVWQLCGAESATPAPPATRASSRTAPTPPRSTWPRSTPDFAASWPTSSTTRSRRSVRRRRADPEAAAWTGLPRGSRSPSATSTPT